MLLLVILWGADRRSMGHYAGSTWQGEPSDVNHSNRLRLATFNIHGGRTRTDEFSLEGTARTLAGFDCIGLNEVRHGLAPGAANQAEWLGRRLSTGWLFAPSERRWWRGNFGNAILARRGIGKWRAEPLLNSSGKSYRNCVHAKIDFAGEELSLLLTHLARDQDRAAQLDSVLEAFLRAPEPAALIGDLNTPPTDPKLQEIVSRPDVTDPLAEIEATTRIDWILLRGLRVLDAGRLDYGSSDHPCYWVEIESAEAPNAK